VLCANLTTARVDSQDCRDDEEEAEYAAAEAAAEAAADADALTTAAGWSRGAAAAAAGPALFQRTARSIAALTGADDDVYCEFGD
jgi:hypothetical protein